MEIRQLSSYHIFEEIGQGLSGIVYKAWDNSQQRPAAIKILRQPASNELFRDFLSTAKALIHVDHPNLCGIYEVGQDGGEAYVIMELIEGYSLKEIFLRRRHSEYDFLNLAMQLTNGLKAIHDNKLIHGNLKPSNIIITDTGEAKILDAGMTLFKNFHSNPEFVAPYDPYHYLSPEHILNQKLTVRSDLFCLGTIFYQLASGSQPFSGRNEDALIKSILEFTPDFPGLRAKGVPGDHILLIEKLLSKNPADRFASAGELMITLNEISAFHHDHEKLQAFLRPPQNPRSYLSIAVLVALLLIFWYVVTTIKH